MYIVFKWEHIVYIYVIQLHKSKAKTQRKTKAKQNSQGKQNKQENKNKPNIHKQNKNK